MNGFRVISRTEDEVPFRAREESQEGCLVFRGRDGFELALPLSVVDALHGLGRRAAPNEFLGLVYGTSMRDVLGKHMVVDGIVQVEGARATHASVASTPRAAAAAEEQAADLYPNSKRAGWCHSHPRYGSEFSWVDKRNQASYGALGIGIVIDPWDERDHGLSVYLGPRSEKLRLVEPTHSPGAGAPSESAVHRGRAEGGRSSREPVLRARRPRLATLCFLVSLALSIAGTTIVSMRFSAYEARIRRIEQALAEPPPPVATAPTPPAPSTAPVANDAPLPAAAAVCGGPEGP